jgi:hypothetical protein
MDMVGSMEIASEVRRKANARLLKLCQAASMDLQPGNPSTQNGDHEYLHPVHRLVHRLVLVDLTLPQLVYARNGIREAGTYISKILTG